MLVETITKETTNLVYVHRHDGIHEFVVKTTHRNVVDDLMEIFDVMYANAPADQVMLRLFDIQAGMPPVAYAMQRTRQLLARYRKPPKSRNAMIFKDNLALSLLRPSIRFLPFSNAMPLAFFHPRERDESVKWLLSDSTRVQPRKG